MNGFECCKNTDRELWREKAGDYYSNSIHVTECNSVGIDCGGHVICAPLKKWYEAGKLLFCVDERSYFLKWKRKLALWLLS